MSKLVIGDDLRCQKRELEGENHQFERAYVYRLENTAITDEILDRAKHAAEKDPSKLDSPTELKGMFLSILVPPISRRNDVEPRFDKHYTDAYETVVSRKMAKSAYIVPGIFAYVALLAELVVVAWSMLFSSASGIMLLFGVSLAAAGWFMGQGMGTIFFAFLARPYIDDYADITRSANKKPSLSGPLIMTILASLGVLITSWFRAGGGSGYLDIPQLGFSVFLGVCIAGCKAGYRFQALRYDGNVGVYFAGEEYIAFGLHRKDEEGVERLLHQFGLDLFDRRKERPVEAMRSSWFSAFWKGIEEPARTLDRASRASAGPR